jgi:hypothetical protein
MRGEEKEKKDKDFSSTLFYVFLAFASKLISACSLACLLLL